MMFDFLFRSGIFFTFFPGHLTLIVLGILIACLLKTARGRWIWLAAEVLTLITCEIITDANQDIVPILGAYFFYILAFNLLIGHGIVGIIRGFRRLVDRLNKENADTEEGSL